MQLSQTCQVRKYQLLLQHAMADPDLSGQALTGQPIFQQTHIPHRLL